MWINLSFLLKFIAGCVLWLLCRASALHPIIRHYAEPETVKVCGNSTLYCEVLTPNAKVWWTHNGSAIDSPGSPNVTTHEEYENATLWKLQIACAQLRDMGNYTCNVKTIDSSVHSSVFFRVIDPLSIESSPFVPSELGHTVKVNCSVMGSVLPESIKWIKNGSRGKLESRGNINISQRVISVSKITSYMEILNLTEANFGTYTCLASTNFDTVSANTTVFNKALQQPRNISVKPLGVSVVEVKWIGTPSNIPVDRYEIKVTNEDGSDRTIVATAQHHKPGLHFYDHKIKQLPSHTTVRFQIRACSNEFGCGEFSENNEVTLPGYSSPPLNVTLTCQYDNISYGNYIHATWERPKDPKGTIRSYQFKLEGKANYLDNFGKYITSFPITSATAMSETVREPVDANTNYTITVCAMNDVGCGNFSEATFESTCSTPPGVPHNIPEFELKCDDLSDNCHQLRLEMKRISERYGPIKCYRVVLYKMKYWKEVIPEIDYIALSSYDEVHKDGGFGAYIAESFDREKFPLEVTLGDASQSRCHEIKRHKRTLQPVEDTEGEVVYDGELSADTYYSGFVEVKVIGKDEAILTKRSSLFMPIRTGLKYSLQATALGVICGLLIVIIILAVALCALSKRNNVPEYERNYSLCGIVCSPCSGFAARGTAGTPVLPPPDIKPLKPENLPAAFIERHKDSDLLFQREFEALPEQFRDRTTRASDMLENFFKNRYPDIKAYDQTRVKLSTIDGIAGSDYINANYVMGYKERKKFICAQGPLDRTVNDFWRMIWEQKVEIVVMVTCLEENGKMKCTKYWPEDEEKKYGNITVSLRESNTFSDYILRKFTVSFKKDENNPESRDVMQFHYLTWKDFLAPEYPGGILKFIKRINEKLSPDKGPILIHCSAGVGRTGTLVVIDSLLTQMKEEGQVEIFNYVSSLRKQRNFLVQSLKQYIFIYRALMEFAQFGDTEIEIQELKNKCNQLGLHMKSNKTLLKTEFEKLTQVIEDPKTTDVATTDVHANKNRISSVVPYDRNRVILTPVPSREHSSYINASFIQGYSRNASFIITQDPLENTVNEFWRMVHEQNSPLIIMLSQHPDPQYWPDELECDHINVQLVCLEELSFASKRNFTVTNNKNSKSHTVIHYHFHNWVNEVPSSTSEIIELIKLVVESTGEDSGAVIVHCSEVGHHSAVFITCCLILHQLLHENRVDVFQIIRNIRSQRCGLFQNFESYKFCYQIALELANSILVNE